MSAAARLILVDAHVHAHAAFPLAALLDAAAAGFRDEAARRGARGHHGVCFLVEASAADGLGRLAEATREGLGAWRLEASGEPESRWARSDDAEILLVAGHQLATSDGLEALALSLRERPPEGVPLAAQLAQIAARGALAVVPWGAGKWLGRRGRIVREVVARADPARVFLGDNGGRLAALPRPALFALGEARGLRVLPGSDAFPWAAQLDRVGRTGFALAGELPVQRPAAELCARLSDAGFRPDPFGRLAGPLAFARDQVAIQLRNRLRR